MKLKYKYILFIILCIPIFYGFSFIHEIGHAVAAVLTGNIVEKIIIFPSGVCYIIWTNYSAAGLVYIAGSLLVFIINVPLFIYSIVKKCVWVFYISFIEIIKESLYWAISPFIKWGDAYLLITWAETYKQDIIVNAVYSASVFFYLLIITLFGIYIVLFYKAACKFWEKRLDEKYTNI